CSGREGSAAIPCGSSRQPVAAGRATHPGWENSWLALPSVGSFNQVNEGVLERWLGMLRVTDPVFQVVGRALGDDAASIDQADAVTVFGLVQKVCRYHHRYAVLHQSIDV